jgi:type I restriction enzyme S subunit
LIDEPTRTTTNFHGTAIYWPGADITQIVWLRCYFAFMRDQGVIDWVGVGGSGGHMSPEYFDFLPIPRFSDDVKQCIAKLYHSPTSDAAQPTCLSDFVSHHRARNNTLGIWELDSDMKALQVELATVQEFIIQGKTIKVSLPD